MWFFSLVVLSAAVGTKYGYWWASRPVAFRGWDTWFKSDAEPFGIPCPGTSYSGTFLACGIPILGLPSLSHLATFGSSASQVPGDQNVAPTEKYMRPANSGTCYLIHFIWILYPLRANNGLIGHILPLADLKNAKICMSWVFWRDWSILKIFKIRWGGSPGESCTRLFQHSRIYISNGFFQREYLRIALWFSLKLI